MKLKYLFIVSLMMCLLFSCATFRDMTERNDYNDASNYPNYWNMYPMYFNNDFYIWRGYYFYKKPDYHWSPIIIDDDIDYKKSKK